MPKCNICGCPNSGVSAVCANCNSPLYGTLETYKAPPKDVYLRIKAGGETYDIKSVLLFPSDFVLQVQKLSCELHALGSKTESGIGFIGSLGYVIGASMIKRLVESGIDALKSPEIKIKIEELRKSNSEMLTHSKFIQVDSINNIKNSFDPRTWISDGGDIKIQREKKISEWNKPIFGSIPMETISIRRDYIHDSGDWVSFKTISDEEINVKINSINYLRLIGF
jgi:hypothetical protein